MVQLDEAHRESGGQGSVELGQLVSKFKTPVWSAALKNNSPLVQFLKKNLAKDDDIEYESLVILGLLHCVEKRQPAEKADALYELL